MDAMPKSRSDCRVACLEVLWIDCAICFDPEQRPGDASMTKLERLFAALALAATIVVFVPNGAEAYSRWGYYSGSGQWGRWGWGPWGPGVGWGQGNPYYYGPRCGWVRTRVWDDGHRVIRRVWRCW